MAEQKIVKDGRILKAICKRYSMEYDKKHKYLVRYPGTGALLYNGKLYRIQFLVGASTHF